MEESPFQAEHFRRLDESPDPAFYTPPRLLVHIDEAAIAAAGALCRELLPTHAAVLDLMSSFRSHIPDGLTLGRLAGLGLNAVELANNPQLSDYVIHDLNADPRLPYDNGEFDGVILTVSVQYLTKPVEVFREVARVLRPDAPFIITYSNRMFPTKAVEIWRALDDRERASLVATYFKHAGGYGPVQARDCRPGVAPGGDPLYGVWARRQP